MTGISIIFMLVVGAAIASIIIGFHEMFLYIIANSKRSIKAKKRLTGLCHIVYLAIALFFALFGLLFLTNLVSSTVLGNYIAVIIYTLLLGLMSADVLYLSPSEKIDSIPKAFRRGFTSGSVNNIIPNLYLKTIINLFYLVVLILAQIEDLGLATFSHGISYFFTLNKYGIVIVFAVEKILKSFAPEKKRRKILLEAFVEQEKQEEREREERKNLFKELRALIRERRAMRKRAKEKRKKDNEKK